MQTMVISGPAAKVVSESLGGQPVAALKDWFDLAKGAGDPRDNSNVISRINMTAGGVGEATLYLDPSTVPTTAVQLCLSNGFAVEGAPVFILLTPEQYDEEVTPGMPHRLDSEGNPIKWSDWGLPNWPHHDGQDGKKIVFGQSYGVELPSSALLALLMAGVPFYMNTEVDTYRQVQEGPL